MLYKLAVGIVPSRLQVPVTYCSYPEHEQLQQIVQCYLTPVLEKQLGGRHPVWGQPNKVSTLAGSMVQLYEQVLETVVSCMMLIVASPLRTIKLCNLS